MEQQRQLAERFFTVTGDMRRYLMQSKPFGGITHSEMPILHLIEGCERHGERASTTGLSARMGLSKSSVSQTLGTMEEKGWIRRSIDPDNRRQTVIDLTDEGRRKMQEIFEEGVERIGNILENMGRADAERFLELMEKFLAGAKIEFQRKA
jgi:DNA-binding MarR family transcriptional regulator